MTGSGAVLEVELPWPPPQLSPNSRLHWSKLHRAKRRYRRTCWGLTAVALSKARLAQVRSWCRSDQVLTVDLLFEPPNMVRRDEDNLLASMKSALDGVADALGVDDSNFRIGAPRIGQVLRGGRVVLRIRSGG